MVRVRLTTAALGVAGCLILGAAPASAAIIQVDTPNEGGGNDGHCTLREAITSANTDTVSGAQPGECAAGSGPDVIKLPAGPYFDGFVGDDNTNVLGDFDISSEVTISGDGAAVTTIDGNNIDRVFDVQAAGVVTIQGVTIFGGHALPGTNGGSHNPGDGDRGGQGGDGGGIRNAGTLTVLDSIIRQNAAGTGGTGGFGVGTAQPPAASPLDGGMAFGGDGGNGGDGGGVFTDGPLTLTRVTVTGNVAGPGGHGGNGTGGIGGLGTTGDSAKGGDGRAGLGGTGGRGGGVASPNTAPVTIEASTISGNTAGAGNAGGTGTGGQGGANSVDGAHGGDGGTGFGAVGGFGGRGGGIYTNAPLSVTASLIQGNAGGAGAAGTNGTGGQGGGSTSTGGFGGKGGFAFGGPGGTGGDAGGLHAGSPTLVNDTVDGNTGGPGAPGATGTGGKGGNAGGTGGTGGNGGNAIGGNGGSGGDAGGMELLGETTLRNVTITSNGLGAGAAPGMSVGGAAGTPGGSAGGPGGNVSPGTAGTGGAAQGITKLTLVNTVVAGNASPSCEGIPLVDGGSNFAFPDATCPGANVDPLLGPLADNGGPTATRALLAGSPALDAVPVTGAGCPATDQRGVTRPQGTACDSGAYEELRPTAQNPPGATPDATAPVFLAASLDPNVFAVDRKGQAETAVTAKAKKGTRFRYRLSEPARVVFTIQRARPGRRVKRRCVRPKRSNRKKRKCTRFTAAGRFAANGVAGPNVKRFSGKIGRRALKPGRYRATLRAKDAAGNASKPKRLTFRVVRR